MTSSNSLAQPSPYSLIADFSGNKQTAQAVYDTAWCYEQSKKHQKARELYQYVVDTWPDSDYVMQSRAGLIRADIGLGRMEVADAAVDKLLADFSEHWQIAQLVHDIACCYERSEKHQKARELYQYAVDTWSDTDRAMQAQISMVMENIRLDNDPDAQFGLDNLIAEFKGHPKLPRAISRIQEAYYIRILEAETWVEENYLYPIEAWEKTLSVIPDFFHPSPDLYYFIACCYYQVGEYETAIEHFAIVLENWPNYNYFGDPQHLIEMCFERLENAGN